MHIPNGDEDDYRFYVLPEGEFRPEAKNPLIYLAFVLIVLHAIYTFHSPLTIVEDNIHEWLNQYKFMAE